MPCNELRDFGLRKLILKILGYMDFLGAIIIISATVGRVTPFNHWDSTETNV